MEDDKQQEPTSPDREPVEAQPKTPKPKAKRKYSKRKKAHQGLGVHVKEDGSQIFSCDSGFHHSSRTGTLVLTRHYLGLDLKQALKKRDIIQKTWKAVSAQGHTFWPAEALRDLLDRGVISPQTAKTASAGEVTAIVHTVVKSVEEKNAELLGYRDPKTGSVAPPNAPAFLSALMVQELTDAETADHLRKYFRKLAFEDPRTAFDLFQKLYQLDKEANKSSGSPSVTVNFDGLIAYDASKNRKAIEAQEAQVVDQTPPESEEPDNG